MILYVLAQRQINDKTRRFVDESGLREQVRFLVDADSALITRLGLLKSEPEPLETGVAHPATYVLDREGVVRFVDVREDFHFWLDSEVVATALRDVP